VITICVTSPTTLKTPVAMDSAIPDGTDAVSMFLLSNLLRWCPLEQLFHTSILSPVSPFGHTGGVDGKLVLEILLTTKILPIGIFYPHLNHCLIAEIVGVFEIVRSHHKSCWLGRPAETGGVEFAEGIFKLGSVDCFCQFI
jgi:hypothetical protein